MSTKKVFEEIAEVLDSHKRKIESLERRIANIPELIEKAIKEHDDDLCDRIKRFCGSDLSGTYKEG